MHKIRCDYVKAAKSECTVKLLSERQHSLTEFEGVASDVVTVSESSRGESTISVRDLIHVH